MREHYTSLVGSEWLVPDREFEYQGYRVHVLAHQSIGGLMRMKGIGRKLRELQPDVVYSLSAIGWIALEAALWRLVMRYSLFTGSHTAASTFPLYHSKAPWYDTRRAKNLLARKIPGRLISYLTERCYGPTVDCAEIAWRFFGVQRAKVKVMHLGVDTDVFFSTESLHSMSERLTVRKELKFDYDDIVVVYSGKLTREKNVPILADAVETLRDEGLKFELLVIGDGPERESLIRRNNVRLIPYQPYDRLGRFYRAADIGVWPSNESTSMLDAAACGLPLVVSDGIIYRDHVTGNGRVFNAGSLDSLVSVLRELRDKELRIQLGAEGARKMLQDFSWLEHARRRLREYQDCRNRTVPVCTHSLH
jgi:glycosyltransferase involved in cell wall biosynthesis